ncbi:MAG TPA: GWxTD domain-containing protein [Thermoanaerobaculia bacterium]|jgi:GWxTD domain-containing protein|nr:GWxTD domain-containing protein [Thermoanaerobaculia bacterium]
MKRLTLIVLAALMSANFAAAQTAAELFQKAKAQVKGESWQNAMKTMDALDAEAARPGNENLKKQLEAPLAFYRGVCEANLGQAPEAIASFQTFLADQPNASMDPSMYSKKAVAAFEEARKTGAPAPAVPNGSPSLFNSYLEFKPPANISDPPDEKWAEGPVQWIMTVEEKRTWAGLSSGGERVEFVEKFWEARNPKPGTPDNTFKTGFERRAAFADAHFNQDEKKRGSLTDRGMVFVLLGPPTYGGRRPIKHGEDPSEPIGQTSVGGVNAAMALSSAVGATQNGRLASSQVAVIADQYSGPGTQAAQANNYQEVWHYRKELLPKGVGYLQVDVSFVTRQGYGSNILQRDPQTLTTLDAAKRKAG